MTTSTKVEVESYILYSPTYYYQVKGRQYTCQSSSSSSINPGTSNKTVYYSSKNLSKCMTGYSKSSNSSNYFIDFEINRLTGNLPSDYYNNKKNNNGGETQVNNQSSNSFNNNLNINGYDNISNMNNIQQSQPSFNQSQIQTQVQVLQNQDISKQGLIDKGRNKV